MKRDAGGARALLERAFRDALAAVDVEARVRASVPRVVPRSSRVRIVAVGKAAPAMARGAIEALGDRVESALVIIPDRTPIERLRGLGARVEILRASHPLPDERSVVAAERALEVARAAGRAKHDVLLVLVSGGASALVSAPYRATLAKKIEVVRALLHAHATISELNLVRRHASRIKGGALLRAARPSRVVSLLVSDVIAGAAHDVGSGPSLGDPTTRALARDVLTRYGAPSLPLRESLAPSSADAGHAAHRIVASPSELASAMCATLARAGLRSRVLPARTGDVAWFASSYARLAPGLARGEALVRAAEPTIRIDVARPGRGGRASHLAALVAASLPRDVVFLAAASDGVDGTSDAAGALVDRASFAHIPTRDVERSIARFDTATLHARAGTAIAGGPTGHNLADLHVLFRR